MASKSIDGQVVNVLNRVRSGKLDALGLQNLYTNAHSNEDVSEVQREEIVEAVVTQLRKDHPRHAKKRFGPVNSKCRETMEEYFVELQTRFDLSANHHKNKVKLGGNVISGEAVINDYVSYRNNDTKMKCGLTYRQITHETPLVLCVSMNPVGTVENSVPTYKEYSETSFDEASELFEKYLTEVITSEHPTR